MFKNKTMFTNTRADGLVYNGNERIEDLVNRDTDGDGVSDWQEGLYGTSPTKKDTNDDGVPDNVEIARITGQDLQNGELNLNIGVDGNLTQTDQLSRELFSTVAALNQAGEVDQSTVDKLSDTLFAKIQNGGPRKVFLYSDIKVVKNDTVQAVKNYNNMLNSIYTKYPMKYTVYDVLDKFIIDGENVDESALVQLDPIIKQTNNIISEMAKMNVPESLALLHLDVLNKLQKISESVSDIKLYDTDAVLALSGISQYEPNTAALESAIGKLAGAVSQRLK